MILGFTPFNDLELLFLVRSLMPGKPDFLLHIFAAILNSSFERTKFYIERFPEYLRQLQ
jgi:hypothetical protein